MEKREVILNDIAHNRPISGPRRLFKYRRFDEFAFEMIERHYLYLCRADKLDDPFECALSFPLDLYSPKNYRELTDRVTKLVVDYVIGLLNQNVSTAECKGLLHDCIEPGFNLNSSKLLEGLMNLYGIKNSELVPAILNMASAFEGVFHNEKTQENLAKLFAFYSDITNKTGICSLTEVNNSQVMWALYSGGYTGYCVEYEFPDGFFNSKKIFPVIYDSKRMNDPIGMLANLFVACMIENLSDGKLEQGKSMPAKAFLYKSKEWSFQKEWRIIGDPEAKYDGVQIKAIYLGCRVSVENEQRTKDLSAKLGFHLFKMDAVKGGTSVRFSLDKIC